MARSTEPTGQHVPAEKSAGAPSRGVAAALAGAYRPPSLTSGQLGKIGEDLVKNVATIQSDGSIVFYRPDDDNEGNDFIVKRRYRAADIKAQVKTRLSQRPSGAFELSINAAALPATDPKSIIVIHYERGRAERDVVIWSIPSASFARHASRSAGKYQALLSPSPEARDRWVKYRHRLPELAFLLLDLIDAEEVRDRRLKRGRKPQGKAATARTRRTLASSMRRAAGTRPNRVSSDSPRR